MPLKPTVLIPHSMCFRARCVIALASRGFIGSEGALASVCHCQSASLLACSLLLGPVSKFSPTSGPEISRNHEGLPAGVF